jgi:leader peptidase (prepilin peptidase)/N-methyltransferase
MSGALLFAGPGSMLAAIVAGIFGLMIGSFLNVVIHRLPRIFEREWWANVAEFLHDAESWARTFGATARTAAVDETASAIDASLGRLEPLSLSKPRSRCPHCGHAIPWYENVPVFGWLMLRGRCSECKAHISIRYPIIEFVTGALSFLLVWRFGSGLVGLATLVFVYLLIAMTFIDADTQLLPDDLTYPLLWLGLLVNLNGAIVPLRDAVIGAAAGYLVLWSVYWLFKLIRGKEGMGYGDFKLLAALGAWLGWKMLPVIILFSSLVGAVVGVALIVFARHGRDKPIPFGPYLAGAGLLALLYGRDIVAAYLGYML